VRRFGNKVFFGDAARQDLLEAAGARDVQLLVIAIDEPDKTVDIITLVKKHYPQLKIVARAIDRRHAYQLIQLGITSFRRETFDSLVSLGIEALKLLGNASETAEKAGELFRSYDEESLRLLADVWGDDQSYGVAVKQRLVDLKQVLKQDQAQQGKLNTCQCIECEDEPDNA
jgi:glutathione-regulated potassium-efflux system ancillary protein KefC/glutathione-regulated potassium-efflux system protein KefB